MVRAARGVGVAGAGDNWFPGWKAKVDGRDVPIERVDYLFRGVRIGPGAHTVVFRYEPLSWRIGWIVSLSRSPRWRSRWSSAARGAAGPRTR